MVASLAVAGCSRLERCRTHPKHESLHASFRYSATLNAGTNRRTVDKGAAPRTPMEIPVPVFVPHCWHNSRVCGAACTVPNGSKGQISRPCQLPSAAKMPEPQRYVLRSLDITFWGSLSASRPQQLFVSRTATYLPYGMPFKWHQIEATQYGRG